MKKIRYILISFVIVFSISEYSFNFCMEPPKKRPKIATKEQHPQDIFEAAKEGRIQDLEQLAAQVGPNTRNGLGRTPVHFATIANQIEAIQRLFELGADINARDITGLTPLHQAAHAGNIDVIKRLIQLGANIHAESVSGMRPLHYAAREGEAEAFQALLDLGADVNAQDLNGSQAAHYAAYAGNTDILRRIFDLGSSIVIRNNSGMTPLHVAARGGHLSAIQLLFDLGAVINARDNSSLTPLHQAAHAGNIDAIKRLIQLGANIHAESVSGMRPLHYAAREGEAEAFQTLLDLGADVNAQDLTGAQAAHYAAYAGNADILRRIFDSGSSINISNYDGHTPLHGASRGGHVNAIQLLFDLGADINARDNTGVTPLHQAAYAGQIDAIRRLIQLGANIHAESVSGMRPLHYAAEGEAEAFQTLLNLGADVNAQDLNGVHAAHYAAHAGNADILRRIFDSGSSIDISTNEGHTPLHYAVTMGRNHLFLPLLALGANIKALSENIIQSSPSMQKIIHDLQQPIDQISLATLPLALIQQAVQGNVDGVNALLQKRKADISPQLLQHLFHILLRQIYASQMLPETRAKQENTNQVISIIKLLLRHNINPRQALRSITSGIIASQPGPFRIQLQQLYRLLLQSPHVTLRDRILLDTAQRPISPEIFRQLPTDLIEEILTIHRLDKKTQLNLLNRAISQGNITLANSLFTMFRANLDQEDSQILLRSALKSAYGRQTESTINAWRTLIAGLVRAGADPLSLLNKAIEDHNANLFTFVFAALSPNLTPSSLQRLLRIAATRELTKQNIENIKRIIATLIEAGANPTTIVINNIPLLRWQQNMLQIDDILDEFDLEGRNAQRRRDIIRLLGGSPSQRQVLPPAIQRPLLPPIPEGMLTRRVPTTPSGNS